MTLISTPFFQRNSLYALAPQRFSAKSMQIRNNLTTDIFVKFGAGESKELDGKERQVKPSWAQGPGKPERDPDGNLVHVYITSLGHRVALSASLSDDEIRNSQLPPPPPPPASSSKKELSPEMIALQHRAFDASKGNIEKCLPGHPDYWDGWDFTGKDA